MMQKLKYLYKKSKNNVYKFYDVLVYITKIYYIHLLIQ